MAGRSLTSRRRPARGVAASPQPAATPPVDETSIASIARGSVIVMLGFVLSRLLGLLREMVIGAQYGTSADYDAYVVAFRLPDTLFLLVMSGAFGSAFLPIFVGFWSKGQQARAWRLANAVVTLALTGFLALAAICFVLAPWLVPTFVAPGLTGDQRDLAVNLTRLLLLSPLLLGLGAAAMGILNARKRFAWPAFAPVAYNLGIIGGAVVLGDSLGIYGLALGVVAGAGAHFLLQVPDLWRAGMRYQPVFALDTPGLREMGRLLGPRVLGQMAFQINFIVLTFLASTLPDGRISALNYAYLLVMLPHGIFAMSLATVIFPTLAEHFGRDDLARLRGTLQSALRLLLFLTVPAAAGLALLRVSLVQVLFQWQSFTPESTRLVAEALGWFTVGLIGVALVEAMTRAFYAMRDTITPVVASLATIAVNVALSLALIGPMGHGGLALAFAVANLAEMVVLLVVARQRIGDFLSGVVGSIWRIALATLVMTALLLPVAAPLATVTDPAGGRAVTQPLWLASAIGWAAVSYLLVAVVTRSPEMAMVWRLVESRLRRSRGAGMPRR